MMDATRDKKWISPQNQAVKDKLFNKEANIYDIINSEELDLLYKKNAHLLSRLSRTGKENTHLYTQLSSLTKEKTHLGDKNTVLKRKCLGLKEQISLFARQHREFNHQSRQLKTELNKVQQLQVTEDTENFKGQELLKKQKREIKLFEKKEQVYIKQIESLQTVSKQKENDQQAELKHLQKEYTKNIQSLEKKVQEFYQALSVERQKTVHNDPAQIQKLKAVNRGLSKKCNEWEKQFKDKNKACQLALKEKELLILKLNGLQSEVKHSAEERALTAQSLHKIQEENKKYKRVHQDYDQLKAKHKGLQNLHSERISQLQSEVKCSAEEQALTAQSLHKVQEENKKYKRVHQDYDQLKAKHEGLQNLHSERISQLQSEVKCSAEEQALTAQSLYKIQGENKKYKRVHQDYDQLKAKHEGLQNLHSERINQLQSEVKCSAEEQALTAQSLHKVQKESKKYKRVHQDYDQLKAKHEGLQNLHSERISQLQSEVKHSSEEQALTAQSLHKVQEENKKYKRVHQDYDQLKAKHKGLQNLHSERISQLQSEVKCSAEEQALTAQSLHKVQEENKKYKRVHQDYDQLKAKHEGLQNLHSERISQLQSEVKHSAEERALTAQSLYKIQGENKKYKRVHQDYDQLKAKHEGLQNLHSERISQLQSEVKHSTEERALTAQSLHKVQKENHIFRQKEEKWNRRSEKLTKAQLWLAKESKKIRAYKKEIHKLRKNQENMLDYKNQISDLTKQKEKLKSGFSEQLNLFFKERDALKCQCANLKRALSAGKWGFDQAMLSFQRKYIKVYQDQKIFQKKAEEATRQNQILEEKIIQSEKQFLQEKEESESQIRKQKDKYISELQGELKASKEYKQDLENQIQSLKLDSENLFLKEKEQMQNEIKNLKWGQDKSLLHIEENHTKEIENLKFDYGKRMKNLENSFEKKLQHIRIEMENDLCSEKKRHEIFKNMKVKQIQELKDSLSLLQTQHHELKTKKFVLEKSLKETKKNLDQYLKNSKKWEDQNENLRVLWQDLQKQNETKDQQIRALQKLNRSLSLSLNQNKKKERPVQNRKSFFSNQALSAQDDLEGDLQKSPNHVLADIHFD